MPVFGGMQGDLSDSLAEDFRSLEKTRAATSVAIFYEACLRYASAGSALASRYMAKAVALNSTLATWPTRVNPLSEADYFACFNDLKDVVWNDGQLHHPLSLGGDAAFGGLVGSDLVAKAAKVWDSNFYLGVLRGFMLGAERSRIDTTVFVSASDYNCLYATRIGIATPPPAARAPFLSGDLKQGLASDGSYDIGSPGLMCPGIYAPRARWHRVRPDDKPTRLACTLYGEAFGNTGMSLFCDFSRPREWGARATIVMSNNASGIGLPEGERRA